MYLPFKRPYFFPPWLFPFVSGHLLYAHALAHALVCACSHRCKTTVLFCSVLFSDWGIPANAANLLADRVAGWISCTFLQSRRLCPICMALTLSNKIIIILSTEGFV